MPIVPQLRKPKEEDQEIKVILSYDQVQVQPELQETLSQINNNKKQQQQKYTSWKEGIQRCSTHIIYVHLSR